MGAGILIGVRKLLECHLSGNRILRGTLFRSFLCSDFRSFLCTSFCLQFFELALLCRLRRGNQGVYSLLLRRGHSLLLRRGRSLLLRRGRGRSLRRSRSLLLRRGLGRTFRGFGWLDLGRRPGLQGCQQLRLHLHLLPRGRGGIHEPGQYYGLQLAFFCHPSDFGHICHPLLVTSELLQLLAEAPELFHIGNLVHAEAHRVATGTEEQGGEGFHSKIGGGLRKPQQRAAGVWRDIATVFQHGGNCPDEIADSLVVAGRGTAFHAVVDLQDPLQQLLQHVVGIEARGNGDVALGVQVAEVHHVRACVRLDAGSVAIDQQLLRTRLGLRAFVARCRHFLLGHESVGHLRQNAGVVCLDYFPVVEYDVLDFSGLQVLFPQLGLQPACLLRRVDGAHLPHQFFRQVLGPAHDAGVVRTALACVGRCRGQIDAPVGKLGDLDASARGAIDPDLLIHGAEVPGVLVLLDSPGQGADHGSACGPVRTLHPGKARQRGSTHRHGVDAHFLQLAH